MRRAGLIVLALVTAGALGAPWFAPNAPDRRFKDLAYAPPTVVHAGGDGRGLHIHPLKLVNRAERRFAVDRGTAVAIRWFADGRLATADPNRGAPLLLLGADSYGRDVFARLLYGARMTLALAVVATALSVLAGALAGATAGYAGGRLDALVSRTSDFLLVLPTIYVLLALRAVLPLVLGAREVFLVLAGIFVLSGWPVVARGVRAIVLVERERDYALAARAAGVPPHRIVLRHLLPAARGHMVVQAVLLLPAFILAESTMSYVGLGFPDSTPTWGTLLREGTRAAQFGDSPWMLAPAAAVFVVLLGVSLAVQGRGAGGEAYLESRL